VNRRVAISGTSRGIGAALARHFLDQGDQVFGCSRSPSTIQHDRYVHIRADVSRPTDVEALFRELRAATTTLDILINNAGSARMLPVALTPPDTAAQIMSVNFMGTFLLTHAAVRQLRKSAHGRIVNLTSVAVAWQLDGEAVYASAKAAVEMFTRVSAREFGPFGITCNAVGPSPIRTDLISKVPEERLQALVDRQSIAKWAEVDDVVNVVDFLVRPASRLITGQVVYLGGAS